MKKLISALLALAMVMALLPMAVIASGTTIDYVVVAGGSALCGSNWSGTDRNNEMTLSGSEYVKVYEKAPAGDHVFKVVANYTDGTSKWIGDATDNNVSFTVTAPCDVTITYDPATGVVTATGANVVETTLEIERIVAVGNGGGTWLNGVTWDTASAANSMTEIAHGVYQISYAEVPAGKDYQVKFAANGTWNDSWGGTFTASGEVSKAVYNGGNIIFSLPETTTVTLTLDLSGFDYASKSGAKFTVTLGEEETITPIESVEITGLDAPVIGAEPDFSYDLPANAGYDAYETFWAVGRGMPEDIFDVHSYMEWYEHDEGLVIGQWRYYCFVAKLEASEGYEFADEVTATINGQEAWTDISRGILFVYLPYGRLGDAEPEVIEHIEITGVTPPALDAEPNWEFEIDEDAPYEYPFDRSGTKSSWIATETWPTLEELFSAPKMWSNTGNYRFYDDTYFTFDAHIVAKDGYVFSEDVTATINGQEARVAWDWYTEARKELHIYLTFGTLVHEKDQVIGRVEITDVDAPVVGENADWEFSTPAGSGYVPYEDEDGDDCAWAMTEAKAEILGDIYEGNWYYENYPEDATGIYTFEEGYYTFIGWVEPEEGYVFADDVTATVNGKEALCQIDGGKLYVYLPFDLIEERIVIDSVEITDLTAPALDADANWSFDIPKGVGYAPAQSEGEILAAWAMSDTKPADMEAVMAGDGFLPGDELTFGAGKYYTFVTVLMPEDGYVFSDATTATVDGEEAMVMIVDGMAYVAYTYDPLTEEVIPGTGDVEVLPFVLVLTVCGVMGLALIPKKKEI